jgi:hypothetical protein
VDHFGPLPGPFWSTARRLVCDDYEVLDMLDAARAVINEPHDERLLKDVMGEKPGSGPRDEKGRFIRSDNIRTDRQYGNSRADTLARLRRDRPDIHKRVLGGEITAHAGMVEACSTILPLID